ncbi:N-acetylmuramic acid 6-phosphate etherase [Youngiibacter multivorans]|uniref:N-acetylmuramic acid 6-phosphate etherase n=1 Tax=Youngiibacter multivorans TaxID=937251 RepID=A0ABS4G5L1_9CLOT|nr:N-acetylmuramic acid 6-phosphate etherase [Youngiibacter multivorans]MBP1919852.1 N-acetylmuramic acid 6-phosphate etherase [Youngiibacter multivorans]
MDLTKLTTESRNLDTLDIDRVSTLEMMRMLNREDMKVPLAVAKSLDRIAEAVDAAAAAIASGGRLIYIGAGTSGRLGILDASECPPTFGTDPGMVVGIIAGGKEAILAAVEGAEDDFAGGASDLVSAGFTKSDVLVGIAASGRTPYVLGAIDHAKKTGAVTVSISCNPGSAMAQAADIPIVAEVGPEAITGSTRLKAGTAQKLILNMITTGTMVKLGKVYSNLMVDVSATNEKLVERRKNIVMQATGADADEASKLIELSLGNPKLAILIKLTGLGKDEASRLLDKNSGYILRALDAAENKLREE